MPKNWFEENAPKGEQVAVISPEGESGYIPQENLQAAREQGFKAATRVISPEGDAGWMPTENIAQAKERGFKDWFARNAPGETPTEQPAQFPQYSPVNAGIKRPDLGEQYREDTKAGPFTKPGAAEKATNVGSEELKTAAIATAAGAGGAGLAAGAVEAAPAVLGAIGTGARWAIKNPIVTGLGYHLARELGIPLPKVLDVLAKYKE